MLRKIKESGGETPEDMLRQGNFEDGVHGVKGIEPTVIARMKEEVLHGWSEEVRGRRLVIVEGFLLFGRSVPAALRDVFDVKVLLRASYGDAKGRRERRNGYVTLEGFWQDPPGYFDKVVWPNYLEEHEDILFRSGREEAEEEKEEEEEEEEEADGPLEEAGDLGQGICFSDPRWGLERCLEWIVGVMRRDIEALNAGMKKEGLFPESLPRG